MIKIADWINGLNIDDLRILLDIIKIFTSLPNPKTKDVLNIVTMRLEVLRQENDKKFLDSLDEALRK